MKTVPCFYRWMLMGIMLSLLQGCDLTQFQSQTTTASESSSPPGPSSSSDMTVLASQPPEEEPSVTLSASPSASDSATPDAEGDLQFKGQVLSQSQPVNRALITLEPGLQQTWTYNQGDFQFSHLTPGHYTLHVDGDGYTSRHLKIQVEASQDNPLLVELFPALKEIRVSPEMPRVFMGQSLPLEAHALFQDGSTSQTLKWQVTDSSVAQVDDKGVITGLKAGNTTLKIATLDSDNWQKEIPLEVVRYVFDLIGPGRMNIKSRVRIVADPPADPLFAGAQFTWRAKPAERVKLTPHPAVPNMVIVEALSAGEVEIQASLAKDELHLDSKKINLSIEN